MVIKNVRKQYVEEHDAGVYIWVMPDGRPVGDSDGRLLSVQSEKNDIEKIGALTQVVRHYGIEEGRPYFLSGNRKISDEEYERQAQRQREGLVPDEYDVGAIRDEMRSLKEGKR